MNNQKYETRNHIDEPLLKTYNYGSIVYGCHTDKSDYDYIVIVESDDDKLYYSVNESDANHTVYSEKNFIRLISEHRINVLECIFQKSNDPYLKYFKLDLEKLRREVSAVSSNSFVKCKKKLYLGAEYIGKKSMFHSLRIQMFGIQIAKYGRIVDYSEANYLLPIIMNFNTWEEIKEYCQPIYNKLKSEFKRLAPLESDK